MRENVREFIEIAVKQIKEPKRVIDLGSFIVEGQEEIADLRPLFKNAEFIGIDIREGLGVDQIGDAMSLDFEDSSIDLIICAEALEHFRDPIQAIEECYRILKPEGCLILTSVMNFPIHYYPSDYWRFTPQAFHYMLRKFRAQRVWQQGAKDFPHSILAVASKEKEVRINVPDKLFHEDLIESTYFQKECSRCEERHIELSIEHHLDREAVKEVGRFLNRDFASNIENKEFKNEKCIVLFYPFSEKELDDAIKNLEKEGSLVLCTKNSVYKRSDLNIEKEAVFSIQYWVNLLKEKGFVPFRIARRPLAAENDIETKYFIIEAKRGTANLSLFEADSIAQLNSAALHNRIQMLEKELESINIEKAKEIENIRKKHIEEVESLKKEISFLKKEVEIEKEEKTIIKNKLDRILESTCWKITKPIRILKMISLKV